MIFIQEFIEVEFIFVCKSEKKILRILLDNGAMAESAKKFSRLADCVSLKNFEISI